MTDTAERRERSAQLARLARLNRPADDDHAREFPAYRQDPNPDYAREFPAYRPVCCEARS